MIFMARAYAKINLTLDVTSRRNDGYHTISSVMQTLSLHDILTITTEKRSDCKTEIAITSTLPYLPCEETNLCYKACNVFLNSFNIKGYNVNIDIEKKIPIAAGLGGGSSDGAETLKALNILFKTETDEKNLAGMALALGADVPFFLRGGCQKAEGIGEILTPAESVSDVFILLAKPKNALLSGAIYQGFDALAENEPAKIPLPSTGNFLKNNGNSRFMYVSNMLSPVSERQCPEIGRIKSHLKSCGSLCAEMSGSGAAVFGIFNSLESAEQAQISARELFNLDFCGIYTPI